MKSDRIVLKVKVISTSIEWERKNCTYLTDGFSLYTVVY